MKIKKKSDVPQYIDITDQTFGRLTAIKPVGLKDKSKLWLCRCECGNTIRVTYNKLVNDHTQSCGCMRSESAKLQRIMQESPSKNNTSGVTGVSFSRKNGLWRASIMANGVRHHLGMFGSKDDAAAARKAAEDWYFGPILEEAAAKKEARGGHRPGAGRKKKANKDGVKFQVYASREDHAMITEEAERIGMSRSQLIVEAVREFAAKRGK